MTIAKIELDVFIDSGYHIKETNANIDFQLEFIKRTEDLKENVKEINLHDKIPQNNQSKSRLNANPAENNSDNKTLVFEGNGKYEENSELLTKCKKRNTQNDSAKVIQKDMSLVMMSLKRELKRKFKQDSHKRKL